MRVVVLFICISLSACSQQSSTPLIKEVIRGDIKQVEKINSNIYEISQLDQNKIDFFSYAIMNDHPEIVAYFIKRGVNPNQPTYQGNTPLIFAAAVGNPEIYRT